MFNEARLLLLLIAIPYLTWYTIMSIRGEKRWSGFKPREYAVLRWILYLLTVALVVVNVLPFVLAP
jgi:hypothetical protein